MNDIGVFQPNPKWYTLMPGPCSAFQSVNNFGNRFFPKEKSTAWPLPFSIEYEPKLLTDRIALHGPGIVVQIFLGHHKIPVDLTMRNTLGDYINFY